MSTTSAPPRAPPVMYNAPLGTRWEKEKAAAGGAQAFDLPSDPKNIGPWIIGECVGKGASGRVKIARHKVTGQLAAVKILPLAPLVNSRASLNTQKKKTEKQRLGIDREITMMKLMNHPNILRIYDVYEGKRELFLVLEYVEGGELFDFLVNRGRLHSHEALTFFRQIIYGLNYAHTFSIIHRDLKPENILISSLEPPTIKIADWGMAAFAPPSLQLETSCGSPHYASPEIVNGERYQGNATDIWSCGVILFALLTGRLPFDDKNVKLLLNKVKSGRFDMPAWLDPLAQDLLSRMLAVDSRHRITIPEILSHPWMLVSSAATRCTIIDNPSLPPSPSTLAKPISDATLIDDDLFESLRIIWGRHADSEGAVIKEDLCAPPGRGVHAKAFYFLLGRYREETARNAICDAPAPSVVLTPDRLSNMSFNLGWELDTQFDADVHKKYEAKRASSLLTSAPPATGRSQSAAAPAPSSPRPPSMRRAITTFSRERPASPGGPRPPSVAERSVRTSIHSQRISRDSTVPARPIPRRGYTSQSLPATPSNTSHVVPMPFDLPGPLLAEELFESVHVDNVPAPTPSGDILMTSPQLLPSVFPADDTMRLASDTPDDLFARFDALATVERKSGRVRSSSHRPLSKSQEKPKDKENQSQSIVDDSWSYVTPEEVRQNSSTHARRSVGKDLGNVTNSAATQSPSKKKNRPPPLDFPALKQKRSNFSLHASPTTATAPSPSHPGRLVGSPVVGEFKGWFSNLFGWKHGGMSAPWVLYSVDDSMKTRFDVGRLLARLGVTTELSNGGGMEIVIKCRADNLSGELANHKPVRFRVGFSASSNTFAYSPQPSPLTPQPTFLAAPNGPRARTNAITGRSGLASPISGPTFPATMPVGYSTMIALVYEKGSATTFRSVWRKLKEEYVDAASANDECWSPAMVSTPTVDQQQPRYVA